MRLRKRSRARWRIQGAREEDGREREISPPLECRAQCSGGRGRYHGRARVHFRTDSCAAFAGGTLHGDGRVSELVGEMGFEPTTRSTQSCASTS